MPPEVKVIDVWYCDDVDDKTKKGMNPVTIYPQCPYFHPDKYENDKCSHPFAYWTGCTTSHMQPIDSRSCPFNIHEELAKDPKILTIKYRDGVSGYSFRLDDYVMKKGQNGDLMFEIIDATHWRKPAFICIDPFGCIKYEFGEPNAFVTREQASYYAITGEPMVVFP